MNHDYAHCLDFTEKCPKECFRAQLVRDLNPHKIQSTSQLAMIMRVDWMHLKGTEECIKHGKEERK